MAGTAITNITFAATDTDSGVLFEDFSYTFNGGSSQSGLPAPLADSCTPGTGTLNCTVSGNAPAVAGQYLISLEVNDGLAIGSATATLNVTSFPPGDLIMQDGFENDN